MRTRVPGRAAGGVESCGGTPCARALPSSLRKSSAEPPAERAPTEHATEP